MENLMTGKRAKTRRPRFQNDLVRLLRSTDRLVKKHLEEPKIDSESESALEFIDSDIKETISALDATYEHLDEKALKVLGVLGPLTGGIIALAKYLLSGTTRNVVSTLLILAFVVLVGLLLFAGVFLLEALRVRKGKAAADPEALLEMYVSAKDRSKKHVIRTLILTRIEITNAYQRTLDEKISCFKNAWQMMYAGIVALAVVSLLFGVKMYQAGGMAHSDNTAKPAVESGGSGSPFKLSGDGFSPPASPGTLSPNKPPGNGISPSANPGTVTPTKLPDNGVSPSAYPGDKSSLQARPSGVPSQTR